MATSYSRLLRPLRHRRYPWAGVSCEEGVTSRRNIIIVVIVHKVLLWIGWLMYELGQFGIRINSVTILRSTLLILNVLNTAYSLTNGMVV